MALLMTPMLLIVYALPPDPVVYLRLQPLCLQPLTRARHVCFSCSYSVSSGGWMVFLASTSGEPTQFGLLKHVAVLRTLHHTVTAFCACVCAPEPTHHLGLR